MADRRRQLGGFAVVALVLLRLAIGWHFYREGSSKLTFDPGTRRFEVDFSAEGFLRQAKGPLAGDLKSLVTNDHDWESILAAPKEASPESDAEAAKVDADWRREYSERRARANEENRPAAVEFPPSAPYRAWAERIASDWTNTQRRVAAAPGMTEEAKQAGEEALRARLQQLADYLAGESEAIAEYRHELWRLANLQQSDAAESPPFVEQQIAVRTAEGGRTPQPWVSAVRQLEAAYHDDLRSIARAVAAEGERGVAIEEALVTSQQRNLRKINLGVTVLTVGVGICLLVGLFTRAAAVAGALFLLSVIATQPPWVSGAAETYYQTVELAGLLALAGTGAGRWAGLDFFGYAMCGRLFGRREEKTS